MRVIVNSFCHMASTERFGYEWRKYHYLLPQYEEQFLRWVHPLTKDDFRDKVVLDAGCGMGRNSYWPLQYGARKVVAFDYDEGTVAMARKTLQQFSNAEITYADINTFQPEDRFDIVFSIGVIHHLYRPDIALKNLASLLKPGGTLLIWVYGKEGNEWFLRFLNPLRVYVTSRLPLWMVHVIAYLFSAPLFLFVRLVPQRRPYFALLRTFRFDHLHSIIFDQLIPKVANYWKREEALQLLADTGMLKDIRIFPANGMSWTVLGTKI